MQICLGFTVSVDVYVVNFLNKFGPNFRDFSECPLFDVLVYKYIIFYFLHP